MYSESEPFNQHKGFPCFDQPDLKAEINFAAVVPKSWIVRANAPQKSDPVELKSEEWNSFLLRNFEIQDPEAFIGGFV